MYPSCSAALFTARAPGKLVNTSPRGFFSPSLLLRTVSCCVGSQVLSTSEAPKEFKSMPFSHMGLPVTVYCGQCAGCHARDRGYHGEQAQALFSGSSPTCLGGRHVNRQLQHNVISVLSCSWAKHAAAKAGPLEVVQLAESEQ